MTAFTSDQLLLIRRSFVRDMVAGGPPPTELLSGFNRGTQKQFASDADLQNEKIAVERDWQDALALLVVQRTRERLRFGDTPSAADANAQAQLLDTVMKLVSAAVIERMLADDMFMRYIPEVVAKAWAQSQRDTISRFRTIALKRQGGLGQRQLIRR